MEKKAIALGYNTDDIAPKLLAKGKRKIAEQIIKIAREYGVPIKEDKELVDVLFNLDFNEYIPEELFTVIAELLAFIYKVRFK